MQVKKTKLPERNNFYAFFHDITKSQVKEAMENNGWNSRKSTWSDFELINDWSEFMIEGDEKEPLLNGVVVFSEANFVVLERVFNTLGGNFNYEVYDENRSLLLEKHNNK